MSFEWLLMVIDVMIKINSITNIIYLEHWNYFIELSLSFQQSDHKI